MNAFELIIAHAPTILGPVAIAGLAAAGLMQIGTGIDEPRRSARRRRSKPW